MRVAVFLYSLGPGGAERQASLLAKALSERYEVEMVLVHDRIFYDLAKSVNVHILDDAPLFLHPLKKLFKLLPLAKKFAAFCNERKIDVAISFMNRPNYINVLSRYFGNKAKVIVSERGSPSHYYKGIEGAVSKWLLRCLYPRADCVIANSLGNKEDLQKNFDISNVATIYNMFDIERIRELMREPIELKKKRFTFVTVGRLDWGKNQSLLIKALHNAQIEADLWIIGEGPMEGDLRELAKDLGLGGRVKFLGKKSNPFAYMAKSDAFVFGSTNEGFPNVLVEALACELPVISTDCPSGPREIFAPETEYRKIDDLELAEYGVLTPVGDMGKMQEAMKLVMQDGKLRYNYRLKALKRAKDFEIDKIIKEWEKLLES